MTDLPYEGATPQQLEHPLVQELLAIHDMFRAELLGILRYINRLMPGEAQLSQAETQARVAALIRAGTQYTQHLHLHHHLETTTLFPSLQAEGLETSVVEQLNAEHDSIARLIDEFAQAIQNLAVIEPAVLQSDLRQLSDALSAHLAYEESHVCPWMARLGDSHPLLNRR